MTPNTCTNKLVKITPSVTPEQMFWKMSFGNYLCSGNSTSIECPLCYDIEITVICSEPYGK